MVEVFFDTSKQILTKLLEAHPEWDAFLEPGKRSEDPITTLHPRLSIPSAHPSVKTPLIIEFREYCTFYWCGSYFCDFVSDNPVDEVIDFLDDFLGERVRCGIKYRNDKPFGGGPVYGDGDPMWLGDYDRVEIKSWKGNRDAVYLRSDIGEH